MMQPECSGVRAKAERKNRLGSLLTQPAGLYESHRNVLRKCESSRGLYGLKESRVQWTGDMEQVLRQSRVHGGLVGLTEQLGIGIDARELAACLDRVRACRLITDGNGLLVLGRGADLCHESADPSVNNQLGHGNDFSRNSSFARAMLRRLESVHTVVWFIISVLHLLHA